MNWVVANPIQYSLPPQQNGDTIYEGFVKTASEFNNIYNYLNLLRGLQASSTPPSNPNLNDLWLNTSTNPPTIQVWNGTTWTTVAIGQATNANYATNAGNANYANSAGSANSANTANYANNAGQLSGLSVSSSPSPNAIPVLDGSGHLTNFFGKARAHRAGALSVGANATSQIPLDTLDFSVGVAVSNGNLIPQQPGYYLVNAQVAVAFGGGQTSLSAWIGKNGSIVSVGDTIWGGDVTVTCSDIIYCNGSTDYLSLYCTTGGSSGNLILGSQYNFLSIIGPF